jgi:histone H3/H4
VRIRLLFNFTRETLARIARHFGIEKRTAKRDEAREFIKEAVEEKLEEIGRGEEQ